MTFFEALPFYLDFVGLGALLYFGACLARWFLREVFTLPRHLKSFLNVHYQNKKRDRT